MVDDLVLGHKTLKHFTINHSNCQIFTILQYLEKPVPKNGTIKLFLLRIKTTNTEMLGHEKSMFETSSTAGVDSQYSSCDCNDKSYFLRLELAKHSFNNLVYTFALT